MRGADNMPNKTKRTLRPALAIEKEVKRDEISTGLNVGVEKLEGKTTARQPIDNTHNTKYPATPIINISEN